MRNYRSSKTGKILAAAVLAGTASFLFTGVVQNTAEGIPTLYPAAQDILKQAGNLSAYLTIPVPFEAQTGGETSTEPPPPAYQQSGVENSSPQGTIPGVTQGTSASPGKPDNSDNTDNADNISEISPEISQNQPDNAPAKSDNVSDTGEITPDKPASSDKPANSDSNPDKSSPETESQPEQDKTVEVNKFVLSKSKLITENISTAKSELQQYTNRTGITEQRFYGSLSGDYVVALNHGQLRNCTDVSNDVIIAQSKKQPGIKIAKDSAPQVLIMHTHTSESYEPFSDGRYDPEYTGRSLSPADSVVGVGAVIAQTLADNGIATVHDGTIHDDPVYSNAYSRSNERVQQLLKQYPDIKIVLDIHRDGIADGDIRIAPVTDINGKAAAQAMIICGCDDGSGILPDYLENLSFACYLQNRIEEKYPTLMRPVLFDYRYYNQDLTTGSLLIEVGALGNTVEQAQYTATLLGKALAGAILDLAE